MPCVLFPFPDDVALALSKQPFPFPHPPTHTLLSASPGMAIFDTMRHIRPDVSTVCVGLAASMGAFLLASGHQGKRYSLANSRIMIHQPLGGAQGQAADIEIQANEILHHKLTLNGYLAEFTGTCVGGGWGGVAGHSFVS